MSRVDLLFNKADWHSVERHQEAVLTKEVESYNADRLLNTSIHDLATYFDKKLRIEVPVLDEEGIEVGQQETQIDVSQDSRRVFMDRSRPFNITGTEVTVDVPFSGDSEVFHVRPTTYSMNPPRASIEGNVLKFSIIGTDLSADAVRSTIQNTVSSVESYLKQLRIDASRFNAQLHARAMSLISARHAKLLASKNLVGSLGFKMKERPGAPKTYVASDIRRKITPIPPAASAAPYKPEPSLSDKDYSHILNVMQNMTQVMELSPSAFHAVDEEALRSHFLVQLNGHYEGQATGETFNYEGKTDILIRSQGKNIFIAECKFWSGPKKLVETIDQLLGYSSWRDTKTAIVVFNRNKEFSKVLQSIPAAVQSHSQYKKTLSQINETQFPYIFSHKDDPNREMTITVMAFDIPTSRN